MRHGFRLEGLRLEEALLADLPELDDGLKEGPSAFIRSAGCAPGEAYAESLMGGRAVDAAEAAGEAALLCPGFRPGPGTIILHLGAYFLSPPHVSLASSPALHCVLIETRRCSRRC